MAICDQLQNLIDQGHDDDAIRWMLTNEDFKKAAIIAHGKITTIHAIVDWEDVMYDGIVRFIAFAQRRQAAIEAGQTVSAMDCVVSFRTICRNICGEYMRMGYSIGGEFPGLFDLPKGLVPTPTLSMAEKLMSYFNLLSQKCQILLEAKFLWNPPENDNEVLSQLVGGTPKATAIPTTINRCKHDLEDIVGDNLDDLLES